ncbi:hypothetical protein [Microbispora sp. H10830]|uniref:hypothetical protein n=1 Tax=Microbispora sp. H10830 TaxID=2729109 RepID=UPI0016026D36|nr:hypothetical protein [Microbispora sp. H10830]
MEPGPGETLTDTVACGVACGVAVEAGPLPGVAAVAPLAAGAGVAVEAGPLLAVGAGAPLPVWPEVAVAAPPAVGFGADAAPCPPFGAGFPCPTGAARAFVMGPLLAVATGPCGADGEGTGGVAVPPGVSGDGVAGGGGAEPSARPSPPAWRDMPIRRSSLLPPDPWRP